MAAIPTRLRPMLRVESLVLVVSAWLVATANGPWWSAVGAGRSWLEPASWVFVSAIFVALTAMHFALLSALVNRWTVKPLLGVLVIATAAAAYYMHAFAVYIDADMVRNVLRTDAREAADLVSGAALGWVLCWSAPPLLFLGLARVGERPWLNSLLVRAGSIAGALVVAALAVLLVSRDITSFMRNHREARYLITPGNLVVGLAKSSAGSVADARAPRAPVGTDARLTRVALTGRPRVLVLVVGETARAANFSLLGYPRETNPELARLELAAFANVTACGTSTEVSVPCMFSALGREAYDERRIRNSEGLLDVLARAGYAVKWIDNQSGCKGVCGGAGIEYEKACEAGECQDGVLAQRLAAELPRVERDTVIVLHMMGNHGPAYFKRYPREFRRFLPDCATAQLRDCSREQVLNAYDNAILYTDHVLAALVDALALAADRLDTAMIYVSDHGESLGEHGLYLHGIPWAIAPREQTHVPLLVWVSRPMRASGDVDLACLRRRSQDALTHDYLFHSVLGLLNVETSAYRASRDVFEGCRGSPGRAFAQSLPQHRR